MSVYRPGHRIIVLPDATTVRLDLPNRSKNHIFRLGDGTVPWTVGTDETVVDVNGYPVITGQVHIIRGPVASSALYVRQESGGPQTLFWAYEYFWKPPVAIGTNLEPPPPPTPPPPAPTILTAPSISGPNDPPQVNDILTRVNGTYSGTVTSISGNWYMDASPVVGETGETYQPVLADIGKVPTWREFAFNGPSASLENTSNALAAVVDVPAGVLRPQRQGAPLGQFLLASGVQIPDNAGNYDGTGGSVALIAETLDRNGNPTVVGTLIEDMYLWDKTAEIERGVTIGQPSYSRESGFQRFGASDALTDIPVGTAKSIWIRYTYSVLGGSVALWRQTSGAGSGGGFYFYQLSNGQIRIRTYNAGTLTANVTHNLGTAYSNLQIDVIASVSGLTFNSRCWRVSDNFEYGNNNPRALSIAAIDAAARLRVGSEDNGSDPHNGTIEWIRISSTEYTEAQLEDIRNDVITPTWDVLNTDGMRSGARREDLGTELPYAGGSNDPVELALV